MVYNYNKRKLNRAVVCDDKKNTVPLVSDGTGFNTEDRMLPWEPEIER